MIEEYDVAVIGGGVVGCAVLRELALELNLSSSVLIEANEDVLMEASSGNSGIFHTGFDATPGTLEAQCMRVGWNRWKEIQSLTNLPWKQCGAILVAWNEQQLNKLSEIKENSLKNGVNDIKELTKEEILKLEPTLSPDVMGGLKIEGEGIVDPWLVPLFYLHEAINHGAQLRRKCRVSKLQYDPKCGYWNIFTTKQTFKAKVVINCSGNYGDIVEQYRIYAIMAKEIKPSFKITPRKGQFVVFKPSQFMSQGMNHIILPFPTAKTKGIIIFPSVLNNLIIVGPTAEDQQERDNPQITEEMVKYLVDEGKRIVPSLSGQVITGYYAGLRPATQFKDYQITAYQNQQWITVAGIRSTGLTASLGIADYIGKLFIKNFSNLFSGQKAPQQDSLKLQQSIQLAKDLILSQKQSAGDKDIFINGYQHRITHKLNKIAQRGVAKL